MPTAAPSMGSGLRLRWCVGAVMLIWAACGVSHEPAASDAGASDAAVADGAAGAGDAGALVAACPAAPPAMGAHCAQPALDCEYGGDWSSKCNVLAQCWRGGALDHTWQVRPPASTDCPTPTSLSAGCPSTPPSGGCSSSDPTGLCVYATARCACIPYTSSGPGATTTYTWQCEPPSEAGCPPERPRIGSACHDEGLTCTYAVCGFGGGTYCTAGAWTEAISPNACSGAAG